MTVSDVTSYTSITSLDYKPHLLSVSLCSLHKETDTMPESIRPVKRGRMSAYTTHFYSIILSKDGYLCVFWVFKMLHRSLGLLLNDSVTNG